MNPFDPETAPGVSLVVLMRIYDALMALLQATDEEAHDKLDAIHESGEVAWSLPFLDIKPDTPDDKSEDDANASSESVPPDVNSQSDVSTTVDLLSNTGHLHTHDTHIER
jgi:hypothetical protein